MIASTDNRRYHSLDQLRAIMMLLGLVIHSAVSFTAEPLGRGWPYQDENTSVFFDIVVFFIHVFRMPLFFMMAGFFSAYLYNRRGPLVMLRNRTIRVVVPFTIFLFLLFPAISAGFTYTSNGGRNGGWELAAGYLSQLSGWYSGLSTMHLWFLYYLILFYAVILISMPLVARLTRPWSERVVPKLGRLIHHPAGFALCTLTTFLSLLPMGYAGLDTEAGFLVQPKILVAYGIFVVFGWLLYLNRDQVDGFARRAWFFMIAGIVTATIYLGYIVTVPRGEHSYGGRALAALAMWTLIYGFMGLFVRYYDRPNPVGRYLADASYWLYLIHLPLAIWIPGLMNGWNVSAFLKSGITFTIMVCFCVVTYHYLVRSTTIGVLLNGKRYPRQLPRFDDKGRPIDPGIPARLG
jgi:glucan biosynthesis protein C